MKNLILMVVVIIAFTITSCKEDAAAKVSKEKVEKAETRDANSGKFPKWNLLKQNSISEQLTKELM